MTIEEVKHWLVVTQGSRTEIRIFTIGQFTIYYLILLPDDNG